MAVATPPKFHFGDTTLETLHAQRAAVRKGYSAMEYIHGCFKASFCPTRALCLLVMSEATLDALISQRIIEDDLDGTYCADEELLCYAMARSHAFLAKLDHDITAKTKE